jgi:hypothetical protein
VDDYEEGSWWEREIDYLSKHLTPEQVVIEANRIMMDREAHEALAESFATYA